MVKISRRIMSKKFDNKEVECYNKFRQEETAVSHLSTSVSWVIELFITLSVVIIEDGLCRPFIL